ncbi:T3SS effector HopA1 family protein [Streptomyces sp. NPDC048566]|uniref:T3SS effector HopA1 family protein n=1 Tax=Streptomyces sp. NPDC048566 TaxID=3365569 RepID=UPI003715E22A
MNPSPNDPSVPPSEAVLAPSVLRLLDETTVAAGATRALVGGREVTADDPRALRASLASALYRHHHMGRPDEETAAPRSLRDPALETRLLAAMPHHHISRPVRRIGDGDATGVPVALDGGLRVTVGHDRVETGGDGVRVRLDAARPAVSPGFFLCEGSTAARARATATLRVYVHVTGAEGAPRIWADVLDVLEGERLPYRAKITSSRAGYPRQDACVIYLGPESWGAAELIADAARGLPGLGTTVSAFVRELAPGVGCAWEPDDARPGMRRVSFGEHRAAALAAGLVAHARDPEARSLTRAVHDSLVEAGVDPADLARNLTSPRDVLAAPRAGGKAPAATSPPPGAPGPAPRRPGLTPSATGPFAVAGR